MTKRSFYLRNVIAIAICLAGISLLSCKESTEKRITAFSITAPVAVGIIDEAAKMITVDVPAGTDVTELVPTVIVSDKATVSPASGVAQNFTNSVVYTVTAEDGSTENYTVTVTKGNTQQTGEPIELKSPITENTTLVDLGLEVDYIYKGNSLLEVKNFATLTIEPGVTIQFTYSGSSGGILITSGSTIKAIGTGSKRIKFIGAYDAKGTWQGIEIRSNTDNQLAYCDLLNVGKSESNQAGGLKLVDAKVGITHCKFTNGKGAGIFTFWNTEPFTAFNNNVFEGFENYPPIVLDSYNAISMLEKFDMTSDFTKNAKPYIELKPGDVTKDLTINQTTVPYYFSSEIRSIAHTLTINEGVTICLGNNVAFNAYMAGDNSGRLMINGTNNKKVKITRLIGTSGYWRNMNFYNLIGSVIKHCIFEYGGYSAEC